LIRQLWVSVLKPRADTGADMRSDMDFQCKTRITTLLLYSNKYFSNKFWNFMKILKFLKFWNILKILKSYEIFWKIKMFEIVLVDNGIFWFSMMSNASIGKWPYTFMVTILKIHNCEVHSTSYKTLFLSCWINFLLLMVFFDFLQAKSF
jgi:hypothetical protein